MSNKKTLPLLPLRDIVVFPHMIAPLFVGREKSVRALGEVMRADKQILLATQKDAADDNPEPEEVYTSGVVASVLQLLKLPDGTMKVLVEGGQRMVITGFVDNQAYFEAEARLVDEQVTDPAGVEALMRAVIQKFGEYVKLNRKVPPEVLAAVLEIPDASKVADTIAAHLSVNITKKQELMANPGVSERLERVFNLMEGEISVLQVERKIRNRVKRQVEKTQRDYYLGEQMKAIQRELGDGGDGQDELTELEEKLLQTKLSKQAREKAKAELKKLRQMSPMSAEATVVRNYLDWMLELPWGKRKRVRKDLDRARRVLNRDHFGLEQVKERVIDHLAVHIRVKKMRGPILCFVGPPGVGKTSLGRSIAEATGREFVRVSLGGVRDEAEIRGHRRTYIGSMPGRIIQSLKKGKSTNPVIMLDEIDKLGTDYRGDPASALLEVLDPEQNAMFSDHYLEVDYDLSDVMFITTANTLNLPQPLLDRLEVIRIAGYTEDEKVEIARRHLIPRQLGAHGLKESEWRVEDSALRGLIRYYTRESGVRNLEREIASLARKSVRRLVSGEGGPVTVSEDSLNDFVGVRKFRFGETESEDKVGIVTGLAWTETGGDLLTIEAVRMPGRGVMKVTGNLKEVMKESISAANSFVQSRAPSLGVRPTVFRNTDIHVHVPEGATPKDGPSAGGAMITAIVSTLTGIPVRKDVAMTGEITLRGRILPIGGLKEKLLAALRGGVKTVLIPQENSKNLAEIPDNVKEGLKIIAVETVEDMLATALVESVEPVEWTEADAARLAALTGISDVSGSEQRLH